MVFTALFLLSVSLLVEALCVDMKHSFNILMQNVILEEHGSFYLPLTNIY